MVRPVNVKIRGPDGQIKQTTKKKEFWRCGLGLVGGGRLRQTKLPFSIVVKGTEKPFDASPTLLTTTSEGKGEPTDAQTGLELSKDRNE